jgi:hypothetical protein
MPGAKSCLTARTRASTRSAGALSDQIRNFGWLNMWYHAHRTACPSWIWKDMVMRLSSILVAPSAVAILSTALLCGLSGTAVSQTATDSATRLPSITVQAPKQVARLHRPSQVATPDGPSHVANTGASRRTSPTTRTPSPAPDSVLAKLARIEKTASNCTDGCQTSFKYGNAPWNGCSGSGGGLSTTCRNGRNYKSYLECRDSGLFLGWKNPEISWYCSSLAAAGKFQVAELKRSGRPR